MSREGDRPSDDRSREDAVLRRIEEFRKRRPRLKEDRITTAHGAGGKASAALVDAVFLEAFRNDSLSRLTDAATLDLPAPAAAPGAERGPWRLAFTTDSFVVKPLRFPGGSIGHLAVHGTVNDLAVMGAVPTWLTAAFVLEEGLPIDELRAVVADMAEAAAAAGVQIVSGDTKVVNRGAADGLYIPTAGIGLVPAGLNLDAASVRPGDRVLVSGTMGDHGIAVMLARGDLALQADTVSDTAPVAGLVQALLAAAPGTRWMRDPTRGGLATVCNELAAACRLAVVLSESAVPVRPEVKGASELLGIDALYVANEGKVVAVVPAGEAEAALAALRAHPLGTNAAEVGRIADDPPGMVLLETGFGGSRVVDMLVGDPLPRIC